MVQTTPDLLLKLHAEGMRAGGAGASILANPMYYTENLPEITDEGILLWEACASAWESGWHMGRTPRPAIPVISTTPSH